ncbi:hypothetical protein FJZ33_10655 [Candidatus Poribacteria bacterium]|nr:hypothetical protein [Candidatus Poribacteria bacterium]
MKSIQPVTKKLDSLWDGIGNNSEIGEILDNTISKLSMPRDEITGNLIDYIKRLRKLEISNPEMERKAEIALAKAMDIYLTVNPDDKIVTRGQRFKVQVSLTNCGKQKIENISFDLKTPILGKIVEGENLSFQQLEYNETATGSFIVEVFNEAPITLPAAKYLYDDIFMKPLIQAVAHYKAYDMDLSIISESKLDIAEDMAIYIYPEKAVIPISDKEQRIRYVINVINQMPDMVKGRIMMLSPHIDWDIQGSEKDFNLLEDQQVYAAFDLIIPPDEKPGNYTIQARSTYKMPDEFDNLSIAGGSIRLMDVKIAQDIYVGYVKSYDNTMEWSLKQLNVKSKALESDDLRFGDLSVYDTIILDIRAYLVRKDLIDSNQRLLDYVRNGGNLIVMYNKTFEWKEEFAPYKLIISNNRVTVEDAPIEILAPDHPLFNFPNTITQNDWEGWIQERGLYFPSEWSPEYKELISCNDPGENPLTGGYLIAQYGKGTYIYTSYVWYRQLQELNPGAFRNFANMISLPKHP